MNKSVKRRKIPRGFPITRALALVYIRRDGVHLISERSLIFQERGNDTSFGFALGKAPPSFHSWLERRDASVARACLGKDEGRDLKQRIRMLRGETERGNGMEEKEKARHTQASSWS